MRKNLIAIIAVATTATLVSCDSKTCVCYESINGQMTQTETLTDPSTRCNTLSTSRVTCVEVGEEIDPSQMAVDYKR